MMNRKNRWFLLVASVLISIALVLTGCRKENIIEIIIGIFDGNVEHHSKPFVIVVPDGRRMPAPAVGTEFTVAVDAAGTLTVQAHVAPKPIAVYEPDGVTRAFTVREGKQVTAPRGEAPSPPTDIEYIDPSTLGRPVTPPVEVEEAVELEIWHPWAGEPPEEALWAAVERFREQVPEVEIRLEGMGWDEMMEAYPASVAQGAAPDLALAPSEAAIEWAAQELIQPLDDAEEQGRLGDVHPTALDTLRYEGRLWGIPIQASTVALYYNRALLEGVGLGPPSATDDLWTVVEVPFESSLRHLIALPDHIYYTYGFLEGYGGRLVDEAGNVVVESEGTHGYLTFIRDLVWGAQVHYAPPDEVQPLFMDYQAAMIVDGVWMLPAYRETLGDALGVTLLPRVTETERWPAPVLGTDACVVSAGVSDAERGAAIAFAPFLTGEEFQEMLIREGNAIPINPWVPIDDPHLAVFAEQANLASPGIVRPNRGEIWDVAQRMLERVIYEELSPEEAAEYAAAELYEMGLGQ